MQKYDVVINSLQPEFDVQTALMNLSKLFKTDLNTTQQLVRSPNQVVKANITEDLAAKYMRALTQAGANCSLRLQEVLSFDLPTPAAVEPPPLPQAHALPPPLPRQAKAVQKVVANYTSYDEVPWFRKNLTAILFALFFTPPLFFILITGDIYYVKKQALCTYSKPAKIFLIIWSGLTVLYVAGVFIGLLTHSL